MCGHECVYIYIHMYTYYVYAYIDMYMQTYARTYMCIHTCAYKINRWVYPLYKYMFEVYAFLNPSTSGSTENLSRLMCAGFMIMGVLGGVPGSKASRSGVAFTRQGLTKGGACKDILFGFAFGSGPWAVLGHKIFLLMDRCHGRAKT